LTVADATCTARIRLVDSFPLDLERTGYSYIERPNAVLLSLLEAIVLRKNASARVLDVGCGAGANARALKAKHRDVHLQGVEPNRRAAELAAAAGIDVFHGVLEEWLAAKPTAAFDAVVLSDVLEHTADPVKCLRDLLSYRGTENATFVVSVPNYAVWYNRVKTLLGNFNYSWSGLYDRTHLRFFTKESLMELLAYLGLRALEVRCTPSIVQSAAPLLRRFFDKDVAAGEHLSLTASPAFKAYTNLIEPIEAHVCGIWPELLGFQIVVAARRTA
jgi:methionine biosynthesis protein MetW